MYSARKQDRITSIPSRIPPNHKAECLGRAAANAKEKEPFSLMHSNNEKVFCRTRTHTRAKINARLLGQPSEVIGHNQRHHPGASSGQH
jgi:hypothetical protein